MTRRRALLVLCWAWAAALVGASPARADTDVGNVAVIEADPTILQPGELFDLGGQTLTFTPRVGGGYTVSVGTLSFDGAPGTDLNLGLDSSVSQPLSFTFPFFGVNRTSVFINTSGTLTFGSSSATLYHFNAGGSVDLLGTDLSAILDRIAASPPRIALLWQDWNPDAGAGGSGAVSAKSLSDRLVVTWSNVPLNGTGTATTGSFQVVLFQSGVIQLNFQSVPPTPGGGYLVGISPGSLNEFFVTTLDFSQGSASSISTFPNFEPLVQVFGNAAGRPPGPLVHISAVARRFYRTHTDDHDQMVTFATFTNAMGNAFAFELTTRQTVSGIGLPLFNNSSFFGSAGRLQSFLNMNRLDLYPADPTTTFLGTNTTLDLMGQESGHMWLAFVRFDNAGVCSDLLLGRDLAHWSFFHDTDASDMEGNKWQDNGNGTFTTIEATARFSALDQYIMGLKPAGQVPTFFFIDNPTGTTRTRSSAPAIGVTAGGTRRNVTVNQVVTCSGARSPASGFSAVNTGTTWKQVFILLIPAGSAVSTADTGKVDTIRAAWVSYFNTATAGAGAVSAILQAPAISVAPASLDFGTVTVGSSADRTFSVSNVGAGTLGGTATVSAPFSVVAGGTYSLAAGQSQTVTVRFTPASATTYARNATFTGGAGATPGVTGTGAFTDGTLTAGSTIIKAAHFTEVRAAINILRARNALAAFTWTTSTLTPGVTVVKRVDLLDLRQALNEAYQAAGRALPTYTQVTVVAGQTVIKAIDLSELRAAVRALD